MKGTFETKLKLHKASLTMLSNDSNWGTNEEALFLQIKDIHTEKTHVHTHLLMIKQHFHEKIIIIIFFFKKTSQSSASFHADY